MQFKRLFEKKNIFFIFFGNEVRQFAKRRISGNEINLRTGMNLTISPH